MNCIATLISAGTAMLLLMSPAAAQDVVQAGSAWYAAGEAALAAKMAEQPNTGRARNVILFIADGMGVGTNYAIRLFDGQRKGKLGEENILHHEAFPYTALVKTYNLNAQTPDSAATAGAINSGVKQVFGTINAGEDAIRGDCASQAGEKLTLFSELAASAGKSVGVVSTARITHATGAAVYARAADRNWEAAAPEGCTDIATQLVDMIDAGVIDLALGGGARNFVPAGAETPFGGASAREDAVDLIARAKEAGATVVTDASSLESVGATPLLGLFTDSHMNFEEDRTDSEPSLAQMTEAAITRLKDNEEGFYLMVEGGRVDQANHAGNAHRALKDGAAFAEAVALADRMTDDADTLIIVTADHDHGLSFNGYCGRGTPITGLCMGIASGQVKHTGEPELAADGKPYTVIGYLNGAGSVLTEQADHTYFGTRAVLSQEEAVDPDFHQQALIPMEAETHSGADVAAWSKGPWAHLMAGSVEQNFIFHVMNHAMNVE